MTSETSLFPSSGGGLANDADALAREVARRRTFAIISHPDAGKTTLTEKLLLYAGAIELAGAVRGRQDAAARRLRLDGDGAAARHLDQRGGARVRARRAPRHAARHTRAPGLQRRHLPDAARGRQRRHGARRGQGHRAADAASCSRSAARAACRCSPSSTSWISPRSIRSSCSIRSSACSASRRRRSTGRSATAPPSPGSTTSTPAPCCSTNAARAGIARSRSRWRIRTIRKSERLIGADRQHRLIEAAGMIQGAGTRFDLEAYRQERQTPVFFGSALNDFGVEPFLRALHDARAQPGPTPERRRADSAHRSRLLRVRVQDAGEHEPASPRPRGVSSASARDA